MKHNWCKKPLKMRLLYTKTHFFERDAEKIALGEQETLLLSCIMLHAFLQKKSIKTVTKKTHTSKNLRKRKKDFWVCCAVCTRDDDNNYWMRMVINLTRVLTWFHSLSFHKTFFKCIEIWTEDSKEHCLILCDRCSNCLLFFCASLLIPLCKGTY